MMKKLIYMHMSTLYSQDGKTIIFTQAEFLRIAMRRDCEILALQK